MPGHWLWCQSNDRHSHIVLTGIGRRNGFWSSHCHRLPRKMWATCASLTDLSTNVLQRHFPVPQVCLLPRPRERLQGQCAFIAVHSGGNDNHRQPKWKGPSHRCGLEPHGGCLVLVDPRQLSTNCRSTTTVPNLERSRGRLQLGLHCIRWWSDTDGDYSRVVLSSPRYW